MPPKSIRTDLPVEVIVTCPQCKQDNRLVRQQKKVIYQCGNCQDQLPDPFTPSSAASTSNSGKFAGLMIVVGVLLGIASLITFSVRILSEGTSAKSPASTPTPSLSSLSPRPLPSLPVPGPSVILQNRSLPASKILVSPSSGGDGTLKVTNGTPRDAYVKLINSTTRKLMAAFYVKSKKTFTLDQIPDGTYEMLFVTGEDWDAKARSFTRSNSFTKFDKSLKFVTERLADGVQYTIIQVSLNPVAGGNVTLRGVDGQEFGQY